MQGREFLMAAGAVAAAYPMRNAEFGRRNRSSTGQFRTPHSAFRISPAQEPSLSPEVFARRLERARAELEARRSEEHTSELQSLAYLVCRLLLEKKKKKELILPSHSQSLHSD